MRDVERDDIEFISRTLGCLPIAHVDHMRPEKLGHAKLVEEESVSPACCFLSLCHLIACLQISACTGRLRLGLLGRGLQDVS